MRKSLLRAALPTLLSLAMLAAAGPVQSHGKAPGGGAHVAVEANALAEPHEGGISPSSLFDQAEAIADKHFYNPAGLQPFRDALRAGRETAQTAAEAGRIISQALRALQVSHTARFTPDQIEYFELLDIFQTRGHWATPAMHDGHIAYEGIGMVGRAVEGQMFAAYVYDGGPAAKAGLRVGDEIVAVDGTPYHPIESFRQRGGGKVTLAIKRQAAADIVSLEVPVVWIRPNEILADAIRHSVRVVEKNGQRIGTIRLWTFGASNMRGLLTELLSSEPLRSADGLVLDLRSRWGGYGSEAADLFLSRTREMSIIGSDGQEKTLVFRWQKPMVAIIDQGTRSSMEIIAYSLQQAGIPLIGTRTAGAVLTVRSFLLHDHSLMLLATNDVRLDGKRFEGIGVSPDIGVAFDLPYADGADPQFDRAVTELQRKLGS